MKAGLLFVGLLVSDGQFSAPCRSPVRTVILENNGDSNCQRLWGACFVHGRPGGEAPGTCVPPSLCSSAGARSVR